ILWRTVSYCANGCVSVQRSIADTGTPRSRNRLRRAHTLACLPFALWCAGCQLLDTAARRKSGGQIHPSSINHGEELLPRQRIIAEAAQHSARDHVCARLVHAAIGHAVMRGLYNNPNALAF